MELRWAAGVWGLHHDPAGRARGTAELFVVLGSVCQPFLLISLRNAEKPWSTC